MSTIDIRYPAHNSADNPLPSAGVPNYNSTLPSPPEEIESARRTRCATGTRFLTTPNGILNFVIIVSQCFFCVFEYYKSFQFE